MTSLPTTKTTMQISRSNYQNNTAMKKIIVLLLFLLVFSSCYNDLNDATGLKKGDRRYTETEYCIVVEKCDGFNALNYAFWKFERIIPKDSINQEIPLY